MCTLESFPLLPDVSGPFMPQYQRMIEQALEQIPSPEDKTMNVVRALQQLLSNEDPRQVLSSQTSRRISCLVVMIRDPLMMKKDPFSVAENATVYGQGMIPSIEEFRLIAAEKIGQKISILMHRMTQTMNRVIATKEK